MLTIKKILLKSARLFSYLTLLNIMLSIILNLYLSGNISISSIVSHFGNLSLVEAAILFLIGGATDFIHTAKWSQAKKNLNLGDRELTAKATENRLSQVTKTPERGGTEWTLKESREAERKALVYILVGMFLCLELVFFALTSK